MEMPINDQGFFVVKAGDTIAITVTASSTAYLAKFPKQPVGAKWSSIQGPDATKETLASIVNTSGENEPSRIVLSPKAERCQSENPPI